MRTRTINFKQKQSVFWDYFLRNTTDTRCMRNTANFYIRNTMTGLKKDPADRTEHEKEVLRDVFHGIEMANIHAAERYHKKLASLARTGGMKSAVACSVLKQTVFTYPTKEKWFLNYGTLDAVFKETRHPVYTRMASQVNQNAIRKTVRAWEGYFKALREYNAHPEKFHAMPGIPGYIREQESTAWWTRQTAKLCIRNGKAFLQFVGMKEMFCIGREDDFSGLAYVKTEISPYHGQFKVMVTFDDKAEAPAAPERPACILGIDTGLDNLLAVAGNFGCHPFIIKGGPVKAVNQWYNKRRAKLLSGLTKGSDSTRSKKTSRALRALSRKREDALRDMFYKCAWYIVRYAKAHKVDVIVIGHTKDQKQDICMGKQNNQSFVSVPYDKIRMILQHVAGRMGIPCVEQEESYTSQASILDSDPIPVYGKENGTVSFSGKRIHRGLYRSADGTVINADVNGAANILCKRYPYAYEGQDLSYLWETTDTVSIHGWYVSYKKRPEHKVHTASGNAKARHRCRSQNRLTYMQVFNATKSVWTVQSA